jgi:hypothetical protein
MDFYQQYDRCSVTSKLSMVISIGLTTINSIIIALSHSGTSITTRKCKNLQYVNDTIIVKYVLKSPKASHFYSNYMIVAKS